MVLHAAFFCILSPPAIPSAFRPNTFTIGRKELDRTCKFFEAIRAIQVGLHFVDSLLYLSLFLFQSNCNTADEANRRFSLTQELLDDVRLKFGVELPPRQPAPTPAKLDLVPTKSVVLSSSAAAAAAAATLSSVSKPLAKNTPKIPKKSVRATTSISG